MICTRDLLPASIAVTGVHHTVSEIQTLVNRIAAMPEHIIRPFRLWSHPACGGLIVVLLGAFRTGRKLAGLV